MSRPGPPPKPDYTLDRLYSELHRARRGGLEFDDAWPAAMEAALQSAFGPLQLEWLTVLDATREAWRAGYERRPPAKIARAAEMLVAVA